MAEKPHGMQPRDGVVGGTYKSGPGGTLVPDTGTAPQHAAPQHAAPGAYTSSQAAVAGTAGMVREAVGVFDSAESMQAAIDDLAMTGFAPHELSLMANDDTVRDRLGGTHRDIADAKADPSVPRTNVVSPEDLGDAQGAAIGIPAYVGAILATGAVVASGGTALAAAAAAVAAGGGGGAVGGLLARWLGQQRENMLQAHLEKGGILLWVNLRDGTRETLAREILARHSAHPVEVHEIPQATAP